MRARTLSKCLPAICRAITGQKGIQLIFEGPPRTDGRTIYSYPLPINASDDEIMTITGDIDHECGHILYTDFKLRSSKIASMLKDKQELYAATHNALEDTMIEHRLCENFLGCRETLSVSAELEEAGLVEMLQQQPPSPASDFSHYLDAWGRVNVLGQNVNMTLGLMRQRLEVLLEPKAINRLDALLASQLFKASSTQETWALTEKVVQFLEDLVHEEEEPDDKPDDPENSGDAQNASDPSDQGDDSLAQADSSKPDDPMPMPSKSALGAMSILNDQNVDTTPLFDRRKSADKAVESATESGGFVAGEGYGELSITDNPQAYADMRDALSSEIRDLQNRIVTEYQTKTHQRTVQSESGRIDGRRLYRAILGDARVFRTKTVRTLPYPAVSLVLDCSSSMKGSAIMLAKQAMIAVAEVNANLRIATEIVAFAGDEVSVIKPYDKALSSTTGQLGGLNATSTTPAAEAMFVAGQRILARKEDRKLMMLITDGMPDNLPHAQEVANLIQASRIELYGLGIGAGGVAVKEFCPNYSLIQAPQEIAMAILGVLRDRVLRAA